MKKRTRSTTLLVAAGATGLAGLVAMSLATSPALAGARPGSGRGAGPGVTASAPGAGGYGMGGGMRPGMVLGGGQTSGAGQGADFGDGTCPGMAGTAVKGTLTDQQKATLADMAQEEKLAHDLYVAFAARYDAVIFDRIARSETRHVAAVRTLLDRYGLTDPTAGGAAGQFTDQAWQADYDRLLERGSADENAALGVGKAVERADIDDLEKALDGLTAPDVRLVYTHLLTATRHHLTAFETWSSR